MTGKKDLTKAASTTYAKNHIKRSKKVEFEDRFYTIVSLGTIATGILACLASVGIGLGLMLAGTMFLAEL